MYMSHSQPHYNKLHTVVHNYHTRDFVTWYITIQALHEKGAANTDHTTLLLNCYTKLKDVQKLDEFIKVGLF